MLCKMSRWWQDSFDIGESSRTSALAPCDSFGDREDHTAASESLEGTSAGVAAGSCWGREDGAVGPRIAMPGPCTGYPKEPRFQVQVKIHSHGNIPDFL